MTDRSRNWPTAPPAAPAEQACPNCGQPMLAGWGTTCGRCRPNLVAPKTLFMARADVPPMVQTGGAAAQPLVLGWLVVLRSPDSSRRGLVIELLEPATVLSRAGRGAPGPLEFNDEYMSSGHAVIRRPGSVDRHAAFTINDRDSPGPSVNGTFVNSHKLAPGEVARLSDGDAIQLGTTELMFKSLWLPPPGGGGR